MSSTLVSILANIGNDSDISKFLSTQESIYLNYDTPFTEAQQISDKYMLMKQRKPMVIEYYKDPNTVESVEMYINPNRLQIQNQKIKGKAYTRGGIFYHHYGDDHPTMSLGGTVGLSGMRGIEQLEKIYYHSGALLKYKDLGPDTVGTEKIPYINLDWKDSSSVFNSMIDVNLTSNSYNKMNTQLSNMSQQEILKSKQAEYATMQYVSNMYRDTMLGVKNSSEYKALFTRLSNFITNEIGKRNGQPPPYNIVYEYSQKQVNSAFGQFNDEIKIAMAQELANAFPTSNYDITTTNTMVMQDMQADFNVMAMVARLPVDQAKSLKNYIGQVRALNKASQLDPGKMRVGWEDISDELLDEWRPRQIFIYFEDRVFIGHFDSFGWTRSAESVLINYEMRFTIIRQIIATSSK